MEDNYALVSEERYRKSRKELAAHYIREFFIVFFGTICIFGFIVSISFLIQLYNHYRMIQDVSSAFEGNITVLIIVSIICFLWTVQLLVWFRKEKMSGGF
jgi:hypothetical protein